MLAGNTHLKGGKLKMRVWKAFAQAPKTGWPIEVMRKSHKVEWARYSLITRRWVRGWFGWKRLDENGSDPVTHYA
jgi:hypothetical protein